MALRGWQINLSGASIPVYQMDVKKGAKIGNITANECFANGQASGSGYEGWGDPVVFLNSSHQMTYGAIDYNNSYVDFGNYASNGTSWVAVSTLKRKVQYETVAYYADGSTFRKLPAGSYVWLTKNCTRGENNPNYVAVTKVQIGNEVFEFSGNGFVDLTYGGRWVNVGSILLRKA